jgi:DNA-binding NtrC family response regulator
MFGRALQVLLIGRKPGDSMLERLLRKRGCHCCFASSYDEAISCLRDRRIELILSPMTLRHTSMYGLMNLLSKSDVTLCYWIAVENDCWWLPAIQRGEPRFGTCALRSEEFARRLNKILDELSSTLERPGKRRTPAVEATPILGDSHRELVVMRPSEAAPHIASLATHSHRKAG